MFLGARVIYTMLRIVGTALMSLASVQAGWEIVASDVGTISTGAAFTDVSPSPHIQNLHTRLHVTPHPTRNAGQHRLLACEREWRGHDDLEEH